MSGASLGLPFAAANKARNPNSQTRFCGYQHQCDISTGTGIDLKIVCVTPPRTIS